MEELKFRSCTLAELYEKSLHAHKIGALSDELMADIKKVCVVPDDVDRIKAVTVYQTSDGSRHPTLAVARAHALYVMGQQEKKDAARELMLKRWPNTKTREASYRDGYEDGLEWRSHWRYVPGGPHISSPGTSPKPEWKALCEQEKANHRAWMSGWEDGLIEQYRDKPLPDWFSQYIRVKTRS